MKSRLSILSSSLGIYYHHLLKVAYSTLVDVGVHACLADHSTDRRRSQESGIR